MSDRTRIQEHSLKINVQKYTDIRPIGLKPEEYSWDEIIIVF